MEINIVLMSYIDFPQVSQKKRDQLVKISLSHLSF